MEWCRCCPVSLLIVMNLDSQFSPQFFLNLYKSTWQEKNKYRICWIFRISKSQITEKLWQLEMLPDLETDFETPNMVSFLPIYFTIVQLLELYFPKTEYSQLQIRYHHSPRFQSLIDKITSIYKCLKFSFEMYCQNRKRLHFFYQILW